MRVLAHRGDGMRERPVEIARFELAACVSIMLAQLAAIADQNHAYSVWDFTVGAVLLASILLVSRLRKSLGRLIWSGLMIFFLFVVVVGMAIVAARIDIDMPFISNLDLFLSLVGLACNIAAAYLVWSAPASKWLADART